MGIVVLEAESALLLENGATRALKLCEQATGVCLKQWALLPPSFLAPCHEALLTIAQVGWLGCDCARRGRPCTL